MGKLKVHYLEKDGDSNTLDGWNIAYYDHTTDVDEVTCKQCLEMMEKRGLPKPKVLGAVDDEMIGMLGEAIKQLNRVDVLLLNRIERLERAGDSVDDILGLTGDEELTDVPDEGVSVRLSETHSELECLRQDIDTRVEILSLAGEQIERALNDIDDAHCNIK